VAALPVSDAAALGAASAAAAQDMRT
jgi:hypothetical protein